MKNLENYGVLEMDTKEMKDVDGGFLWGIFIGSAIVGLLASLFS